jgi:class 3 adenylate cyclase
MGCLDQSQNENLTMPLLAESLGTTCSCNHSHDVHRAVTKSVTALYPNTTVFYSQIVGFTAWSSQRAPDQVFELLETVFCEFDEVANRGAIFKVESIADSYIAVTGIPEVDPDHAVRMAQFASDCLAAFLAILERLERSLGPDTGDLQLRIGIHSGPVTAGVLKGDRSRFQLFGNTVNNGKQRQRGRLIN